jgi:hypothetical protein
MDGFLVAGRQQLRMWIILGPPYESHQCAPPTDSPLTPWNETAIFTRADGALAEYSSHHGTLAWGEIMGRLAARWPHLVGWNSDDMSNNLRGYPAPLLAAVTARIRQFAPWFVFAPTIYYRPPGFEPNNYHPDRHVDLLQRSRQSGPRPSRGCPRVLFQVTLGSDPVRVRECEWRKLTCVRRLTLCPGTKSKGRPLHVGNQAARGRTRRTKTTQGAWLGHVLTQPPTTYQERC